MEVRRLSIPINEDRKWESLYYGYDKTITHCVEIIDIFDSTNMTDQDRINILQRVLD